METASLRRIGLRVGNDEERSVGPVGWMAASTVGQGLVIRLPVNRFAAALS
jgi:hypothetical protein